MKSCAEIYFANNGRNILSFCIILLMKIAPFQKQVMTDEKRVDDDINNIYAS